MEKFIGIKYATAKRFELPRIASNYHYYLAIDNYRKTLLF